MCIRDSFTYVAQAASEEEMQEAIESGQAKMALGIPKDFDKDIKSGLGSDILDVYKRQRYERAETCDDL